MRETEYIIYFKELLAEFDQYVLEHPDFVERIPGGAQIVFVDQQEPDLAAGACRLLASQRLTMTPSPDLSCT